MNRRPAEPAADFAEVRDITVIGAGPVGMSAAFWAGMREASVRLVDALPELGGQLTALYPEKWIFDVLGHPRVRARELVERLRAQTLEQFDIPVHLGTTVERIAWEGSGEDRVVILGTARGELRSRAVVIAGGHGSFEPRRLSGYDLSRWEARGVHYLVASKDELAGKRVLVIGGGDSALDWVLNLLGTARSVALVHRRERFRAHELTVSHVRAAAERGEVAIHVPFQIRAVSGEGAVERVRLFQSDDAARELELEVDAILLALGFKTSLGPMRDWGFELAGDGIVVDTTMRTSLERVWACGDITSFDGKLKLIATGFAEAATAVAQAVHVLRPDTALQPGYSTNTGVPGAVVGQP